MNNNLFISAKEVARDPSLLQVSYSGNTLLTGGICKIEGSMVVLFLNLIFIIIFSILNIKRGRIVR